MKVILIDDSRMYLKNIELICKLSKLDSEIKCFIDAFEAMMYISKHHHEIRIVFTDYEMKSYGMSGVIVAEKCNELSVPVVICTGHDVDTIKLPHRVISKLEVNDLLEIAQNSPQRKAC